MVNQTYTLNDFPSCNEIIIEQCNFNKYTTSFYFFPYAFQLGGPHTVAIFKVKRKEVLA